MSEQTSLYESNVTVLAPLPESFTEVRCPACVKLGWPSARMLFKVHGTITQHGGAEVQIKCPRCSSIIGWVFGLPILRIIETGQKNDKKQHYTPE